MSAARTIIGGGLVLLGLGAGGGSPATGPGVRRALAEWARNIHEVPEGDASEIDKYIRGPGGAGWSGGPYDGREQWCGFFAGWALGLHPLIRKYHMPGVTRLIAGHGTQGHWAAGTGKNLAPGNRFVRPEAARAGDIAIVGNTGRGQHITIVTGRTGNGVDTVEGNAWGLFPDGSKGEGVIRTWRPFNGAQRRPRDYYVMHVIRPLPADFEGA